MDKHEKKKVKASAMAELKRIQEFLREWDPIGVIEDLKEAGLPPDEYDSYAGRIHTMLRTGCNIEELAEHLNTCESEWMGLGPGYDERNRPIAGRIIQWWRSKPHGINE